MSISDINVQTAKDSIYSQKEKKPSEGIHAFWDNRKPLLHSQKRENIAVPLDHSD